MPPLSHHFGLSPAEVLSLTSTQLQHYLRALEQIEKAASSG